MNRQVGEVGVEYDKASGSSWVALDWDRLQLLGVGQGMGMGTGTMDDQHQANNTWSSRKLHNKQALARRRWFRLEKQLAEGFYYIFIFY